MDTNYRYYEHKGIGIFEFLHDKLNYDNSSDSFDHIKNIITKKNISHFIFDIKKVLNIDSVGIGFLIAIKNVSVKKGSKIHLVCDSELVLKVLSITRMESFFKIFPSFDDAVTCVMDEKNN